MELSFGDLYTVGAHNFLDPTTFLLLLLGTFIGIIFGALPGLGTPMALAVFTPLTYSLGAVKAMVFLLGLYGGCVSGGSMSAILLNIPGTPSSIATGLDGHPMTRQGRAGEAIGIAALASATGGIFGALVLSFMAPMIASLALSFSAQEYVALTILTLCLIGQISGDSLILGLLSGAIGLMLAMVGADVTTAYPRFAFGSDYLQEGIPLVALIVGIFGIGEVLERTRQGARSNAEMMAHKLQSIIPKVSVLARLLKTVIRSSVIGVFIGATPAAGASIASVIAYGQEKRFSKNPEKFGKGAVEGVAAAEAANNSSVGGALIPMLTLGIPGDPMGPILMGALMLHGLAPGPLLFQENPEIVSVVFLSMLLGAIALGVMGVGLARVFSRVIQVPPSMLLPGIVVLCVVGTYAMRHAMFDVGILLVVGLLSYGLRRVRVPLPPLVLGFILGPLLESNMRRALLIADGDWSTFILRPISGTILVLAVVILVYGTFAGKKKKSNVDD